VPGATFLASGDSPESSLAIFFGVCHHFKVMKWWLTVALAVVACDSESEAPKPSTGSGSGSAKIGSAGGFAASMSADLAKTGDGSGKGSDSKGSDSKGSDTGSDAKTDPMAKGSDAKGSDAKGSDAKGSDSKVADAKGSDAKTADTKDAKVDPKDTKVADAKAGSAAKDAKDTKVADAKAGSAAKDAKAVDPKDTKVADAKAGSAAKDAKAVDPKDTKVADAKAGSAAKPLPPPPPVKAGELAAIKLNMEPNWDRDVVEAGTISLVEKRSGKTFTFHYGFDDPRAPVDREQYKHFLEEQKLLKVTLDRQRGAAWYLEGTDGNGAPAFRYLVNYGGKKLICGGSLYKDAESSKLGDIRDRLVIQAKQICESLSL
jgi:hypothetical protein